MKNHRSTSFKIKSVPILIIIFIVSSSFLPIISASTTLKTSSPSNYLFLNDVTETEYHFTAVEECYILVNIEDTDITNFKIDGNDYTVSFGLNIIPINFIEDLHLLEIAASELSYFDWITVEPTVLVNENVSLDLSVQYINNFYGGGMISILAKPGFAYNWLDIELDGNKLNEQYDTDSYPVVDSQIYSFFVDGGQYIRFDVDVLPGLHTIKMKGNGSLEYKVIVNFDWDEDEIFDAEELQKSFYLDLDPHLPNKWGFFEKLDEYIIWNPSVIDEGESEINEGRFSFYIPESGINFMLIEVFNGKFTNFNIDGDELALQGTTLQAEYPETQSSKVILPHSLEKGWHYLLYNDIRTNDMSGFSKISFKINGQDILILDISELKDNDGDGVKDLEESSNGLNYNEDDFDDDGLPDSLDNSPLAKLTLNRNKIHQMIINTDSNKETAVSFQIRKPNIDYSTNGIPRLWRDELNVSIFPVMRLFGNMRVESEIQENGDIITTKTPMDRESLSYLWGKDIQLHMCVSDSYLYNGVEGLGDPLPISDNPDMEYWFVFPKQADQTFEYNFIYPKLHPAKTDDDLLDLRFDFVWLVTTFDTENMNTDILHYYNFEEDIIVQTINKREMNDVNYVVANPDNHIESQIIWALLQNPDLGLPSDYGVESDIIYQGVTSYSNLATDIMPRMETYYINNPLSSLETEVLYVAGYQENEDILNKIIYSDLPEQNEKIQHQGDYESYFSFYSINNVYPENQFSIGDAEIQGESKIIYQISNNLFSEDKSATLMGVPIELQIEDFYNYKVLKITQALGGPVPLDQIPMSNNGYLHHFAHFRKQTIMEYKKSANGIPTINFDESTDIYKEYFDNNWKNVPKSDRFYKSIDDIPQQAQTMEKEQSQNSKILRTAQNEEPWQLDTRSVFSKAYYQGYDAIHKMLFAIDDAVLLDTPLKFLNTISDIPGDLSKTLDDLIKQVEFQRTGLWGTAGSPWLQVDSTWDANARLDIVNRMKSTIDDVDDLVNRFKHGKYKKLFDRPFEGEIIEDMVDDLAEKTKEAREATTTLTREITSEGVDPFRCWIRSERGKAQIKGAAMGSVCIVLGVISFAYGIAEMFKLASDFASGAYKDRIVEFGLRMGSAVCMTVLGAALVTQGVLIFVQTFKGALTGFASKLANFLPNFIAAIGLIVVLLDWGILIAQVASGELEGMALVKELLTLGIESVVMVASGIAMTTGHTGVGLLIALAALGIGFLSSWLTSLLNHPSVDVTHNQLSLSESTKLNIRRHGSLEVGDYVNFRLRAVNDGDRPIWLRARFRVDGDGWSEWKGSWSSYYGLGSVCDRGFTSEIGVPTTNLNYHFQFQMDWEKFELIFFIPIWTRVTGFREDITQSTGLVVLDNNIADFFDDTTELLSLSHFEQLYQEAYGNYQYKDAYDTVNQIISIVESNTDININEFESIKNKAQIFDDDYYSYTATDINEFFNLINIFWNDNFRAMNPLPNSFPYNILFTEKARHMLGFFNSNGKILIPKEWLSDTTLNDLLYWNSVRNNLPMKTNIKADLRTNIIEIDPNTKEGNFDFKLALEGSDDPIVDIELIAPTGFSITPITLFSQPLSSNIAFTIIQDNLILLAGVYYIEMNINLNGNPLYQELIPFRINAFSLIELNIFSPSTSIIPGEQFPAINVNSYSSIPDTVEFFIGGIPESLIYKGLHPDNFINESTQLFMIYPGDSYEAFIIAPPRHFTTAPGIYTYNIVANDYIYDNFYFSYTDSFEIAEFYDVEFQCLNPEMSVLDYETRSYFFNITNLGNVPQTFEISFEELFFGNGNLSNSSIFLEPGESELFNLSVEPTGWGYQEFSISAISEYKSSEILASINITDDDINNPIISDLEIIDTPIDISVNFNILNEIDGDDIGVSDIKIFIDDQLFVSYCPDPSETSFSFTFNDGWLIQYGTHEIRIEVIDNDNDVAGDALSTSITDYFNTTLKDCYLFVHHQIEEVKEYIQYNSLNVLEGVVTQKLSKAQEKLLDAYELIEAGKLHTGLVKDKIVETLIELSEAKVDLLFRKSKLDYEDYKYLLYSLRDIRNNTVLLMGLSVGTELGYNLSLIEINLLNLGDFVEEKINKKDSECLESIINLAASKIEDALFDISLGKSPNCSLLAAQDALEHAKIEINCLLGKEKISEELANTLFFSINRIQFEIENKINF